MEPVKINIKNLGGYINATADEQILTSAIYVERKGSDLVASQIEVSGKFHRKYTVVAYLVALNSQRILVADNLLIICLYHDLAIVDMEQNKLLRAISISDFTELFGIYKFKSGYFIHGESENYFLNQKFDIVWKAGCADIFVNSKVEKELEFFDDYITVFDWLGYKHYYNEIGLFKKEFYPEFK